MQTSCLFQSIMLSVRACVRGTGIDTDATTVVPAPGVFMASIKKLGYYKGIIRRDEIRAVSAG